MIINKKKKHLLTRTSANKHSIRSYLRLPGFSLPTASQTRDLVPRCEPLSYLAKLVMRMGPACIQKVVLWVPGAISNWKSNFGWPIKSRLSHDQEQPHLHFADRSGWLEIKRQRQGPRYRTPSSYLSLSLAQCGSCHSSLQLRPCALPFRPSRLYMNLWLDYRGKS